MTSYYLSSSRKPSFIPGKFSMTCLAFHTKKCFDSPKNDLAFHTENVIYSAKIKRFGIMILFPHNEFFSFSPWCHPFGWCHPGRSAPNPSTPLIGIHCLCYDLRCSLPNEML